MGAPRVAYQEVVTVLSIVNQDLCLQKVRFRLLQTAQDSGPQLTLWSGPKDSIECSKQLLPA